jgi:hypothetical protein
VVLEIAWLDGVPVAIANGGVEPQDDLIGAELDVAQIAAFEDGCERPRPHLVAFW